MENPRRCNLGTIAAAALVGGLAGAITGLLIAPKSGRDLRSDLAQALTERVGDPQWLAKAKRLTEDLQSFLQEATGSAKPGYVTIPIRDREPQAENHGPE
ncbi:Uncharacterised protein family YtxH [Acididesulfobacillus acetoxydans]|uniref:YtxH-like protein n=1 Tax=Acididesulfobacillus acetoxydans TaxID=1561005 RepID=A0A8S0XV74_9FIRM|nr:YtxH domain-containing protein [Acididesulfobacillus acetoxydans]CAA7600057.1 Uncharacterised protein family YtxH [Acididesulfobacillus acetoxydans]CEJ07832.1 YtxH-like protein [Acididesulfobacillus acetoxydans]